MTDQRQTLAGSAKSALMWGAGFTLLRDVAQFGTMLILVRRLSPEEYGTAALAQAILSMVAVFSFGTFVLHALQIRDPKEIDWQAHFTAAAVINTTLFGLLVALAAALSLSDTYQRASLPLAGMATVLLLEVPGSLRHRMLESEHDWKRFRAILTIGTLLGMGAGIVVALLGGGVWALVVQSPLFVLPAAVDLFWKGKWRPNWSWNWQRYRETARFGIKRAGSSIFTRGRATLEQTIMAATHDFAAVGIFSRAMGLATLVAGRVGTVAMSAMYPVITRMEERSEQFRRVSSLSLRGVCWISIPSAVFFAARATDVVSILYGDNWVAVTSLLPYAIAVVTLAGIGSTISTLLLANNDSRACLLLDVGSAIMASIIAVILVPVDLTYYVAALIAHSVLVMVVSLARLLKTNGLAPASLWAIFIPPILASTASFFLAQYAQFMVGRSLSAGISLAAHAFVFGATYVVVLRVGYARELGEMLHFLPGGRRASNWLLMT